MNSSGRCQLSFPIISIWVRKGQDAEFNVFGGEQNRASMCINLSKSFFFGKLFEQMFNILKKNNFIYKILQKFLIKSTRSEFNRIWRGNKLNFGLIFS